MGTVRDRFSDCQIVDFMFYFVGTYFRKNMLVRYRGINNKGVLERPGTKWQVLRTISSTLKFQECPKSWNFIIPLFGETENWRPGAHFDAKYVSAPFCHAKTAWIAIWSKIFFFGRKSSFSVFWPIGPLLVPYWFPFCGCDKFWIALICSQTGPIKALARKRSVCISPHTVCARV